MTRLCSPTSFRRRWGLHALLATLAWLSLLGPAAAQTFTVVRTSYGTLFADQAHADAHLCGYTAYRITASSPAADVWATIGNFAGGRITLAATEDGVHHVGPIGNAPDYGTAFFYVCGDTVPSIGEIITGQTHTVTLWDRDPSLPGATALGSSDWSLDYAHAHVNAQANKIDAISVTPVDPVLGGTFVLRVDGRTGTVGDDEHLIFTPAAHPDWPAAAFELVATQIDLPDVPGDPHVIFDDLAHTGLAVNSANTPYFALYTFRVNRTTAAAVETSPYSYIDSGTVLKHTDVSHLLYPVIPPVPDPATLSKSATPNLIIQGTPTDVTFTVTVNNNADQPIALDQFRDVLPAGFSYVPGSASYDGSPIGDPFVTERDVVDPLPEQDLAWIGAFPVPALGTASLVFQASVPAGIATGDYDNCARGLIDGTTIDTTADTADDAPACARVTVIGQPPPGGALILRKVAVGGGSTFDFTAGPAPVADFTLDATAGSGATSFTSLPADTYTITETVPPGWVLTDIACLVTVAGNTPTTFTFSGAPMDTPAFEPGDTRVAVVLGADAQAQCTFTDTRLGAIAVTKVASPGGAGQSFDFTASGNGVSDFALTPPGTPTQSFADLGGGLYTFTETVPPGWVLTGIACTITTAGSNTTSFAFTGTLMGMSAFEPGDTTAQVTLGAGDTVACTFTNVQNGSIALIKQAIGGDGSFGFDTNGTPASAEVTIATAGGSGNATAFAAAAPGSYAITEIVPAGWTLAGITCTSSGGSTFTYTGSGASGASQDTFDPGDTTAGITLAAGDAVTCTFVDDGQALVTVRKTVVPFTTTGVTFDLLVAVGGGALQIVADDVPHDGSGVIAVPANAVVQASETSADGSPISGFTSSWICTGTATGSINGTGNVTSAFSVPPGGDAECRFTNTVTTPPPFQPQPVPTLSWIATLLLVAVLSLVGVRAVRRRSLRAEP